MPKPKRLPPTTEAHFDDEARPYLIEALSIEELGRFRDELAERFRPSAVG